MRKYLFAALVCLLFLPVEFANAATRCSVPISYSLGAIDSRFRISDADVLSALSDAEAVWEKPTGKNLFSYIPTYGKVTVNFIYDDRQAVTDAQKDKLSKLEKINTIYQGIQTAIHTYASSTEVEQNALGAQYSAYKADEATFNADVSALNARGGVSQSDYDSIAARSSALQSRFSALKAAETDLNSRVSRFNTLIDLVNQLATYLNTYIAQYNTTLGAAREYEEGIYEKSGHLEKIDIYQYSDRAQLVRALAHEMGHAIGLGHLDDPNAIMYRANTGKSASSTPADLKALGALCGF